MGTKMIKLATCGKPKTIVMKTYQLNLPSAIVVISVITASVFGSTPLGANTWQLDQDGNWSDVTKWDPAVPDGIGASAFLDVDGGITANRTATLDQNITLGALSMNDTSGDAFSWGIAQGGGFSLSFQVSSGNAFFGVSTGTANAVHVPVALSSTTDFNVATGTGLTISGPLSGAGQLRSIGAGTIRLEGDNSTFSGGMHFTTSTRLEIASANALGTGAITMDAFVNAPIIHNATGGSLVIDNQIGPTNVTGNTTFSGSDMTLNDLRLSNAISINHVFSIASGTTLTLPNGIASGGSRKDGAGNLTINAASNGSLMGWDGGGTLRIGHDQALGSGTTFRARLGTYIPTGGDRTITNQTDFGTPGGHLTFDLSNGNDLTFSNASATMGHDFNITVDGPGVLTIASNITGNMRPDKRGTGTLILSGDNSGVNANTSAGMRLHAGTLGLGHDNALGPNRLDVRGSATTLMAVGGARALANPVVFGANNASLTIDTDHQITFNGLISVPNASTIGNLVVNRGTLSVNGDNTGWNSNSSKTVNDTGTLIVGHNNALGAAGTVTVNNGGILQIVEGVTLSRPVTFNSGATLAGSGTYQTSASVSLSNVTLSPGNSIGTLTIDTPDSVIMDNGSILAIQLAGDGSSDLLRITGGGALTLNDSMLSISGTAQLGHWYTVAEAGGVFGEFGVIDISGLGNPNYTYDTRFSENFDQLQISIVPEPAASVALLGLISLLFCLSRRRFKVSPRA